MLSSLEHHRGLARHRHNYYQLPTLIYSEVVATFGMMRMVFMLAMVVMVAAAISAMVTGVSSKAMHKIPKLMEKAQKKMHKMQNKMEEEGEDIVAEVKEEACN